MTIPGQPPPAPPSYPAQPLPARGSAQGFESPGSSPVERLRYVAIWLVVGLVASVPVGWLWVTLADPPSTRLTATGLTFGESSFDQVSAITFWFFVVGFGAGGVLGLVAALLGRRHGLVSVLAILLMCWAGAALTLWSGIHIFGPDQPIDFVALLNATPEERTTMLAEFENGDRLVSQLDLTTGVALLGWPAGGMAGALAGAFYWPKTQKAPWMPPR